MNKTDLNLDNNSKNITKNTNWNFNTWIAKTFLDNPILTLLCLFMLIIAGVGTTLSLKTTGFPNPELNFAIVRTRYAGASSETVVNKVTIPLENAIKGVEGVKRFNSTSSNEFSVIQLTLDEKKDINVVKNKIDAAVKSVVLPTEADTPLILAPDISGADVIFAVTNSDLSKLEKTANDFIKEISQLESVSKVEPQVNLNKQIVVKINNQLAQNAGITALDIQNNLSSLSENLPASSDITLDNKNTSLVTKLKPESLETLANLNVYPSKTQQNPNPQPKKLSEVANVTVENKFEENKFSKFAFNKDSQAIVNPAVTLEVRGLPDADKSKMVEEIKKIAQNLPDSEYIRQEQINSNYQPNNKTYIIEAFSSADSSKEQVDQVIGGLIGSKIGNSPFSYLGFLLGGIQLVMLFMIAFVSWRAALVAGAAIPLSLGFSMIWVYVRGEQLNTLVLFSLVLVVGLVVDPALVILEAIQRKIDTGLKGKEAALEAIKDVGNGIFLAALTNIIAFVPFGVISGIFGAIFSYIPFTIIPAIVGSYIVPLIFLAWVGGLILKKNKNTSQKEEENIWPIAKLLIKINTKILNSAAWIRTLIIIFGFIIPILLTFLLFKTEKVRVVEFVEGGDVTFVFLQGTYLSRVSIPERAKTTEEILKFVTAKPEVTSVVSQGMSTLDKIDYVISLKPKTERTKNAKDLTKEINQEIQLKYGENSFQTQKKFFDIKATPASTGGPQNDYQISVLIENEDPLLLEKSSIELGKTIKNELCKDNQTIKMDAKCSPENKLVIKIDDGFTDKENSLQEIILNRDNLIQSGLAQLDGRTPLTIAPNQIVSQQFGLNNRTTPKLNLNGEQVSIILENSSLPPKTISEVSNNLNKIVDPASQNKSNIKDSEEVKLQQLQQNPLTIKETKPKASIQRIKGKTVAVVSARLKEEYIKNQGVIGQSNETIIKKYNQEDALLTKQLGLEKGQIKKNDDGSSSDSQKTFTELGIALVLAILISYIVLAVFFKSLTLPLSILYTVPLALLGAFPALALFVQGQFGFLEIIGFIILVGIVENVAIFLIDSANQKIDEENWDDKKAIAYASGIRFRPVFLTSVTAVVSLAPLAITSDFYRSIAVIIMFGILASGMVSLITTPILFIFFRRLETFVKNLFNKFSKNNK
jgi:multidrug efflux pump subunit AcrB